MIEDLPRPAEHHVFGTGRDAVVVVPARVASWLNARGLNELRAASRGVDPNVDNVLSALALAGAQWLASVHGTTQRKAPEMAPLCPWMTTAEVADLLYLSDRAVRMACKNGRLRADQIDGRWRISREDFEHFRAARAQRAA
jgi:excisionase family DNA binding protein